jgi:hypothetical protein
LLFPPRASAIKQINIPGDFSFSLEDALPEIAGQGLRIDEVRDSLVPKAVRELSRFASKVSTKDRQPDDVSSYAIIGDILESLYDVGEPPTAQRSRRRNQNNDSHLIVVALKDRFQLFDVAEFDLASLTCGVRSTTIP